MTVRIVAIIQARTGSSRLPRKVLLPVLDRPLIEHQIERVKLADVPDRIVLATTELPEDKILAERAERLGVEAFRGHPEDVLDRVYRAAAVWEPEAVIRLTGDCPLLDPAVVDSVAQYYLDRRDSLDYVGVGPSYPEGQDVEVLSFAALERAWKEAERDYEREHVTPYIWQSGRFRTDRIGWEPDLSHMRWTVDEEEDYRLVEAVYEALYPEYGYGFGVEEIVEFLRRRPEVAALNQGIQRNEGFLESLRKERAELVRHRSGSLEHSEEYWARADGLIPAGTQTLSKGPTQYVNGVAPKYLVRGEGCHVWDVDGNEYIDYPMGLGAVILGYNYPATTEAVREQVESGTAFSLMHPLEVEVGELLREIVPCAEMVRFAKNGSDATTGAVRVARAFTGREKIAHCGYHGWHDWYIGSTSRNKGVPSGCIEQQFPFEFNDLGSLERIFQENPSEIAAVIMEPYGATLPEEGFLEDVKELSHKEGAVLIFDEVASGFRFHLGGVHQYFGMDPDLACFGKAIGNGLPLSALVGRAEIMRELEDEVFYSFTFGGEALSLAAAKATIVEMRSKEVVSHLWEVGERLKQGFNRLVADFGLQDEVRAVGLPPRTFVTFKDAANDGPPPLLLKSLFQQEVVKRGVLSVSAAHCISYSHTVDDVEYTLGTYQEAFEVLQQAMREERVEERLEGEPIRPVFRPVT